MASSPYQNWRGSQRRRQWLDGRGWAERPPAWAIAPNLAKSFYFAGIGILYTFRTQRNFRIHLLMTTVALGLGLGLGCSPVEMVLITFTCGLVLALELLNTALEAVVDLTVGREYHLLAKIAKDCAAGAVLMAALTSLGVVALLLIPPLVRLLPLASLP